MGEEKKYLHFTQWGGWKTNLTYSTVSSQSNYWERKLAGQQDYFSKINSIFNTNFIPQPCQKYMQQASNEIIPVLEHGKYASELLKEYIFEEIRATEFESLPSRKRCMFLFDENIDPKQYARTINFDTTRYRLILIKPIENLSRTHRASLSLLNCNFEKYAKIVEIAREYWGKPAASGLDSEVLLEGKYVILKEFK